MKEEIKTVSQTVISKPMKTKKPWFVEVCKIALNQRRELKNRWLNDPRNINSEVQYKRCRKKHIIF